MPSKKCPVCGVSVKVENLQRHVKNQHPRAEVDLEAVISQEERREIQRAKAAARPAVSRKGIQWAVVLTVVIAVILVLVVWNPFRGVGVQVGQVAPDFTLVTTTGSSFTLSSYRGSPVLLEFMDVDCEYCALEAPVLASLFADYSGQGVRFVSVDIDFLGSADTVARIDAFKTQHGTNWVYVLDSSHGVKNTYGIDSTPTTFILDRDGVIQSKTVGQAQGGYNAYATVLDTLV